MIDQEKAMPWILHAFSTTAQMRKHRYLGTLQPPYGCVPDLSHDLEVLKSYFEVLKYETLYISTQKYRQPRAVWSIDDVDMHKPTL